MYQIIKTILFKHFILWFAAVLAARSSKDYNISKIFIPRWLSIFLFFGELEEVPLIIFIIQIWVYLTAFAITILFWLGYPRLVILNYSLIWYITLSGYAAETIYVLVRYYFGNRSQK